MCRAAKVSRGCRALTCTALPRHYYAHPATCPCSCAHPAACPCSCAHPALGYTHARKSSCQTNAGVQYGSAISAASRIPGSMLPGLCHLLLACAAQGVWRSPCWMTQKQPEAALAQAGTSFLPLFQSAIFARRSALVSRLFLSSLPLSRSLHPRQTLSQHPATSVRPASYHTQQPGVCYL